MHQFFFSDGIFILALILSARLPVLVLEIISMLSSLFQDKNTGYKFPFWKLDPSHGTRLSSLRSDDVSSGDLKAIFY